ncbi:MAG TPA: hypothetical protein VHB46_19275 [Burkholderiales bacterium]|nr:hypothetical protein [Burkholderiales bacterium]
MHTVIVICTGFVLLGLCAVVGYLYGGKPALAPAVLAFLPIWLAGAGFNMVMGVKSAGYSVAEETPMFFLVFGMPAIVAIGLWWWLR